MLLQIHQFKDRVEHDINALVRDLQQITGRSGEEEGFAWRNSLPKVSGLFHDPSFDPLHLYFGSRGSLSLEYQLPGCASWCDIVLLGSHEKTPSAVILELKDWQTRGDRPGAAEGMIHRHTGPTLHPSDQVRGYVSYCRRFHSAVHDRNAQVHGCVVFTKDFLFDAYSAPPNQNLVSEFPCFSSESPDSAQAFPRFFESRLTEPDEEFAEEFEHGEYRQDRGFVRQIGKQILDPKSSPFELLDNQRFAFSACRAHVEAAVFAQNRTMQKKVILIEGPPGSGKSVVAARLWAALVTDERLPAGNAVFTTTSASQSSNWTHLFNQVANDPGAGGAVKKATGMSPITTHRLGALRRQHGKDVFHDAPQWRENLEILRALGEPFQTSAKDDLYLVNVIDEAHALINPEHSEGRGQFGFAGAFGPQAYHVMRTSLVSVFLLDPEQSFRDRENTSVADIKQWATELGADLIDEVSLAGAQFRCAGSKDFVDWVEALLGGADPDECREFARKWFADSPTTENEEPSLESLARVAEQPEVAYTVSTPYKKKRGPELRLFSTPAQLESALRERVDEGNTARLLASYAREWKTKGVAIPHDLPPQLMDFHEPYEADGGTSKWSRPWNFVPGNGSDYTHYIQAVPGSHIGEDPLGEVGCPYAVRGFDFDYVGILWLEDFLWDGSEWRVDPDFVFETGINRKKSAAVAERDPDGPAHQALRRAVAQSYRILLTRALKGVFLWVPDTGTRSYIESCLKGSQ